MSVSAAESSRPVNAGILVSGIVVLASSIFLIVYDKNLMKYGIDHWYGLIAYIIIIVILLALSFTRSRAVRALLVAIPVLFIVLIIIDAALNLPLSQFYSPHQAMFGFRYLFGFGVAGDSSKFSISIALVIDLVFSAVLAGAAQGSMRKSR